MKNRTLLMFAMAFMTLTSCANNAKIVSFVQLDQQATQYEKNEWEITLKANWTDSPYNSSQTALDMIYCDPNGEQHRLPCFYVAGNSGEKSTWKARFAPTEQGSYKICFELRQNNETVDQTKFVDIESAPAAMSRHGVLHPNNNWTFVYHDGTLFRGIGENICWESRDTDDNKFFSELHQDASRYNYDFMLRKLAANGGNFFRVWMIYWNMPVDWKTPANNRRYQPDLNRYNRSAIEHMDHMVELCDSLGIHFMLALESHVALMGEGWELSNYNVKNGGPAQTPTEFFALPEARQQYKDKLRLMIALYSYSPSIAAWEFFNEVDNAMYQKDRIPDQLVADWHKEMSEYIKATDPYQHMVTTSVSHRDVEGMNSIATMDFNQRHIYCNTLAIPSTINQYTDKYQKPYVIGEQGYHWDWSINFNDYAEEFDHDFRVALWLGLFSPTPVLPMSWWWEFFEQRSMMEYFNIVRTISDEMMKAGNGSFQQKETITTDNQTAPATECGEQIFVYVHNASDSQVSVSVKGCNSTEYSIETINTLSLAREECGQVASVDGVVKLPTLKLDKNSDIIYKCTPITNK